MALRRQLPIGLPSPASKTGFHPRSASPEGASNTAIVPIWVATKNTKSHEEASAARQALSVLFVFLVAMVLVRTRQIAILSRIDPTGGPVHACFEASALPIAAALFH